MGLLKWDFNKRSFQNVFERKPKTNFDTFEMFSNSIKMILILLSKSLVIRESLNVLTTFYPVFNFKLFATRFRQPSSPRSTDRQICSAIGPVYLVEGGCVSRFLEILGRNAHVEKRFDLIGSSMVKVSRFLVILGRDRGCSWIKAKVGIKHAST